MQKDIDFSPVYGYNKQANQYASVAQSVVHLTRNEKVACSSQVTSSKKSPRAAMVLGLFLFVINIAKLMNFSDLVLIWC